MSPRSTQSSSNSISTLVHVTREFADLAGAGGIKDVAGGLARASARAGIDTFVFLPFYRCVDEALSREGLTAEHIDAFPIPMKFPHDPNHSEAVNIHRVELGKNLTLMLIEASCYRYLIEGDGSIERHGIYQYTRREAELIGRPDVRDKGYYDYFAMNVMLVKAALKTLESQGIRPDLIHCHDGHAALLPMIAQLGEEGLGAGLAHVPSVVTIHNASIGFQQEIDHLEFAASICGVPLDVVHRCLLNGHFNPLIAAALFGSLLNTVSENYARELQHTPEDRRTGWLGHTIAAMGVTIHGITNGVDPGEFDPASRHKELGLPAAISPAKGDVAGKETCKRELLENLSVLVAGASVARHGSVEYAPETPLLTFVGRLNWLKGYHLLVEALPAIFAEDETVQLLGLGSGDPWVVDQLKRLVVDFPGRVCLLEGFSPELANNIYAAGDFFIVPSISEPCGLTDFYAQLMGNVPIVHAVGGLVKTLDNRLGFSYLGEAAELAGAIRRALKSYRTAKKGDLRRIQKAAVKNIATNFTWDAVLKKKYLPLYLEAVQAEQPVLPYPPGRG